jgi:hypothetical protein
MAYVTNVDSLHLGGYPNVCFGAFDTASSGNTSELNDGTEKMKRKGQLQSSRTVS